MLHLKFAELLDQRPAGTDDDVHFPESLAATVVQEYTLPGQRVLDPFAGYGTTLVVAERMGRDAIGVELLPQRAELVRRRLDRAKVITGDARGLTALVRAPIDLCFTSPPYMTATGHSENPLNAYQTADGDYATYLAEIGDIFRQVASLLRPGGHAVINVANIRTGNTVTPLAWDVARTVAQHLTLSRSRSCAGTDSPAGLPATTASSSNATTEPPGALGITPRFSTEAG
jgi:DNA modification methylase